jgi:hypothetical protein
VRVDNISEIARDHENSRKSGSHKMMRASVDYGSLTSPSPKSSLSAIPNSFAVSCGVCCDSMNRQLSRRLIGLNISLITAVRSERSPDGRAKVVDAALCH